jgi:hypothetical protein
VSAWRNCAASLTLVAEINQRWPGRDKTSDGTIGDAAHAARTSDHNPWVIVDGVGVVRARDVDKDGIDAPWLAEYLRHLGAAGDPRLAGGGYVIFNRRITTPDFQNWRAYRGINPHEHHVHVSFSRNRAGFDSTSPWGITGAVTDHSAQQEDDLTPEESRMLAEVHRELTTWLPNRRGPGGQTIPNGGSDTTLGYAANADGMGYQLLARLDDLSKRISAGGGVSALSDADLHRVAVAVADEQARRLAG